MTAYSKKIEDRTDIIGFFIHIRHDLQLNFHPDDRFVDIINYQTRQPSFTNEICDAYEKVMNDCHFWCDTHKQDIYQIALESGHFSKFLESYKKITNKRVMKAFVNEFIDENYSIDGIIALHTYIGSYWIEEYRHEGKTMFRCIIENTSPYADNLRDMEVVLFDWIINDVSTSQ